MKLIENQKLKLNIRKQGINGEGIGYFNRIAVFVPGAIRKEVVNIEIVKAYDNYAVGEIIDIERESTKRILPPCKFYDDCGNCDMQHIEYNEQLKIKQLLLVQAFKRYTELDMVKSKVKKTISLDKPFNYGNYAEMVLRNTNFGLNIGYFKPNTNHFAYIDNCMIKEEEINNISQLALKLFRKYKLKAYDMRNKEGILYNLVIRYFSDSDEAGLVIVVKENNPKLKMIAKELVDTFTSIKSVGYTIFNPNSKLIIYNPVEILAGVNCISTNYREFTLALPIDAYFPMNKHVLEKIDDYILKNITIDKYDNILNLYSMSGITSLNYAKYAKKVFAIDYSKVSTEAAKLNIEENNISNIEVIQDHVEGALPKLFKSRSKFDFVIFNPPRQGLSKVMVDLLNKFVPKTLVYISKNPSTLAKDINDLFDNYNVREIAPVDMHPQTASIHSVTILDKK
ncbi:MAG: 23S rRNA (uracil(1939)-C(5))-methyltransferase RlmD [Candidatus Izimaplasma sp.]|nr:23S rRNA (uracil(1939)-C(5))-methyltransferase RlmD [Candidatus Izimaplasma bacterium]